MILYSAPASPFGRMVKLTAHCLGQIDGIEVKATNTGDPEDEIRGVNPLGKIPALVADGQTLYDSRVIVEFLDARAGGGRIIPAAGPQRFEVLTRMAAMVGLLDAALLVVYEGRFRPPEMKVESFLDYQRGKIMRVLATLALQPMRMARCPMPARSGLPVRWTILISAGSWTGAITPRSFRTGWPHSPKRCRAMPGHCRATDAG